MVAAAAHEGRNGESKWLLRRVLDRYVPRALIERQKMGFSVPIGAWLRGPLRDWAEDLLDERRLAQRGHLRSGADPRHWHEHLARHAQLAVPRFGPC